MTIGSLTHACRVACPILFAALCLSACGAEREHDVSSTSQQLEFVQTPDGQTLGLIKPGEAEAYLNERAASRPDQPPLKGYSKSGGPDDGAVEGPGGSSSLEVEKKGCWVTLDWCQDPDYGLGMCHQNGGCTQARFVSACISLYNDHC